MGRASISATMELLKSSTLRGRVHDPQGLLCYGQSSDGVAKGRMSREGCTRVVKCPCLALRASYTKSTRSMMLTLTLMLVLVLVLTLLISWLTTCTPYLFSKYRDQ